jgi:hypothetical protein
MSSKIIITDETQRDEVMELVRDIKQKLDTVPPTDDRSSEVTRNVWTHREMTAIARHPPIDEQNHNQTGERLQLHIVVPRELTVLLFETVSETDLIWRCQVTIVSPSKSGFERFEPTPQWAVENSATAQYEGAVQNFLAVHTEPSDGETIKMSTLYARFNCWYLNHVVDKPPNATWFGRTVNSVAKVGQIGHQKHLLDRTWTGTSDPPAQTEK